MARIDWNTLKSSILGTHSDAVKSLVYSAAANLLVSGSWDSTITAWDAKASTARVTKATVPGKVYSMDTVGNLLIVAMSERHVQLFDLRKMDQPLQTRESSLRHQTRCVRLSPTAESFAISSIEGRVGIEMVDAEAQDCNFAFKCHRAPAPDQENTELVYPVNALAFHPRYAIPLRSATLEPAHYNPPRYATLCTGGSDGVVLAWDPQSKKRLRAYPKVPSSVAALAFSRDGAFLATASSYCYEEGEKE